LDYVSIFLAVYSYLDYMLGYYVILLEKENTKLLIVMNLCMQFPYLCLFFPLFFDQNGTQNTSRKEPIRKEKKIQK
jgi:hypothetical protein